MQETKKPKFESAADKAEKPDAAVSNGAKLAALLKTVKAADQALAEHSPQRQAAPETGAVLGPKKRPRRPAAAIIGRCTSLSAMRSKSRASAPPKATS
jgi:hypothetical protein